MPTVFIGLGSNLGNREENLAAACGLLAQQVDIMQTSALYETAPWGYADQPAFLNQVLHGETTLQPSQLLRLFKHIERKLGREKTFHYGPRVIDIDILFYDDLILKTKAPADPASSPARAGICACTASGNCPRLGASRARQDCERTGGCIASRRKSGGAAVVKLLAGLALLLPGLFWWVWCGDREKDPGEALAGILGVSVAFIALIALFFYTIRVSITPPIFGLLLVLF